MSTVQNYDSTYDEIADVLPEIDHYDEISEDMEQEQYRVLHPETRDVPAPSATSISADLETMPNSGELPMTPYSGLDSGEVERSRIIEEAKQYAKIIQPVDALNNAEENADDTDVYDDAVDVKMIINNSIPKPDMFLNLRHIPWWLRLLLGRNTRTLVMRQTKMIKMIPMIITPTFKFYQTSNERTMNELDF